MKIELIYGEHTIILQVEDCNGVFPDDAFEADRLFGYQVISKSMV